MTGFIVNPIHNIYPAMLGKLLFAILCLGACVGHADVRLTDDAGQELVFRQPARRIISLAPYITELLFASGAGKYVIGVSDYSDYPSAARKIGRIGGVGGLDLEAIVALQPDLVIAWQSGNPAGQVARLQAMGLNVFISEPHKMDDIAGTLARFGELAGTRSMADPVIADFNRRLSALRKQNAGREKISVFYQVWGQPLMTVSGQHLISDAIHLCGGVNVFDDLDQLAPQISVESVLVRDPRVIIAAMDKTGDGDVLAYWQRWPHLSAVRAGHLYTVPGDLLVRHTPRILDGAGQVCELLEHVRAKE